MQQQLWAACYACKMAAYQLFMQNHPAILGWIDTRLKQLIHSWSGLLIHIHGSKHWQDKTHCAAACHSISWTQVLGQLLTDPQPLQTQLSRALAAVAAAAGPGNKVDICRTIVHPSSSHVHVAQNFRQGGRSLWSGVIHWRGHESDSAQPGGPPLQQSGRQRPPGSPCRRT